MKPKRVFQLLPVLYQGDGVGNDALALDQILKELGYHTKIYAITIDKRINTNIAEKIDKFPLVNEEDIIIYHFSIGSELSEFIMRIPALKIMIYHNITPANFFEHYSIADTEACYKGREDLCKLKNTINYCLAVSEYNKRELINVGYKCKIDILPILIPFEDYKQKPNMQVIRKYDDSWTNILFVGRIAPNKKQEDLIKTFYYYKNYINPNSRLFLVGSNSIERYYNRLCKYVEQLQLSDVYFTGHTSFDEMLAYYHIADVFLCMSEHEGFCIPLIEAMYFQVPIIAYNATAVTETLGQAGLTVDNKDGIIAAEMIALLDKDFELRKMVIEKQDIRLRDFNYDKVRDKFIYYLEAFLKEHQGES